MEKLNEIVIKRADTVPPIIAEIRRHSENAAVVSALKPSDRAILAAVTGIPIADYDAAALVETLMQMFNFIALDVGYKKPTDATEWQYLVTRIAEILRRYHSDLTTADIKTAFEMLIVGELDTYLPKNGNGEPDRNHYQNFNVEYITKILTAYKKRQSATVIKARTIAPKIEPPKALTASEPKYDKKAITHRVFEEYQQTHRLNFGFHEDVVVVEYLTGLGLLGNINITDEDRQRAYQRYLIQADLGYKNEYEARWVRIHGVKSKTIDPLALDIAQHRAIKNYFDKIIAQNDEKKNENLNTY